MIIGADSTGRDGGNPFWQFSLSLYDSPGVAAACLALQDRHGLDVNLLLFACFAAARGVALAPADVAELDEVCAAWRDSVIKPLRELRRRAGDDFDQGEVKEALLAAELAAERAQQDRLWTLARQTLESRRDETRAGFPVAANLAAVAGHCGVSNEELSSLALLAGELLPLLVTNH